MLNLVSFRSFPSSGTSYAAYVEALKAGIGIRHGAVLKIWGKAEEEEENGKKWCWQDIAA
jgi:hypothetical protein